VKPLIDLGYRLAYRSAYRMARLYWGALHPTTHGSLLAVWSQGELLLVRNSYVPYYSLPGGYVRPGENGQLAALRELHEELGLRVAPGQVRLALDLRHDWEGKREHVEIHEVDVDERPYVRVDNREVVAAEFHPPERALTLNLFPPIRKVVEQRLASKR
jgi:8-oxo-dGTP pyrophosphatase MutT (NUDIX family)